MKKELRMLLGFACLFIILGNASGRIDKQHLSTDQVNIISEFDSMLQSFVDESTGLFDGVGSIDVAVYKLPKNLSGNNNNDFKPLFVKAYGKSQIKNVLDDLDDVNVTKPSLGK